MQANVIILAGKPPISESQKFQLPTPHLGRCLSISHRPKGACKKTMLG